MCRPFARDPSLACRLKAPHGAEAEKDLAPMVDVDLKPLQQEREERWDENLRQAPVGRPYEHQAKADENARRGEENPGETADPTVIGESADIGIMRFEVEDEPEAQRAEARRAFEQHRQRAQLIAETASHALIIVLRQGRPL